MIQSFMGEDRFRNAMKVSGWGQYNIWYKIDGLLQERRNFSVLAME